MSNRHTSEKILNRQQIGRVVAAATLLALILGCKDSSSEAPKQSAPPVAVKMTQPKRGPITRFVTLPGEIKPYQQAILYAKVAGYLKIITVDKGDRVKEGDLIADIEVPEMLADLARYKAEVEVAELDYKRLSESQKKLPDLVVPQTVDNARGKLDVAKASLERTETLLGFAKITAPFSGVIAKRMVDPGAFIPAATSGSAAQNAAIVTLTDFNRVRVQVAVPELETSLVAKNSVYPIDLPTAFRLANAQNLDIQAQQELTRARADYLNAIAEFNKAQYG